MKLSQNDRKILLVLQRQDEMTVKDIVDVTQLHYANVSRRLQVMKKHGIINNHKIFNERHYSINKDMKANYYFMTVECPKCKATREVHDYATHVTCNNPQCTFKSGDSFRFFITKDRIKKVRDIMKGREY